MTSAVKSKVSGLASSLGSSSATAEEAEKYKLLVTAGPSYDQTKHQTVKVNTNEATYVENEFLRAKICVRVRGFRGLPSASPSTSDYFGNPIHEKDQYSLGFSFVPKQDLPSVDTVWGNDLDHPVRDRLPPGFNTAFRIVKEFIDPGLACDVYADEPWLYGPSLSCWFALRIGGEYEGDADFPAPGVLTDGADDSGQEIRDRLGLPENNEKRRKFFLNAENRKNFVFQKGRLYQGDFYNPYLDFANFALKLPGFSLKVIKYIGDKTHCLRYVFKNRETGDVYFNVNFTLLWGEKLQQALREDQEGNSSSENGDLNAVVTDYVKGTGAGRTGENPSSNEERSQESVKGAEELSQEQSQDQKAGSSAPDEMRLHPGDQNAAADAQAAKSRDDSIDEIDRLLRETSTHQKREGRILDDVD
ncbi:hypothetical protein CKM354_000809300 [Cercospora kikuchii]|uniref:Domain of unknown function at the cortex 1 domain-containing protein n=1 Tax=Cercospora kikuchii TaxID=84275 RepID=A0A9P3FJ81_9PEZI|nr:uncharacterized protein CKM354_000809300 [Cercospora kikuchii]GIZ44909.1 hypothetical protein CKM354_000809300 [Cercospora kikuchii]